MFFGAIVLNFLRIILKLLYLIKILNMKKLLPFLIIGLASNFFAQNCVPDPLYTDSIYGFWPDTIQNLPQGNPNSYYQTSVNFKFPSTLTAELVGNDPTAQSFIGSPIQSYNLTSINGLPSFLNYTCSSGNCSYFGGEQGCSSIFGQVPDGSNGPFSISFQFDVTVLLTILPWLTTPITQTLVFSGYVLDFNCNTVPLSETVNILSCAPYVSPTNQTYLQSGTYNEVFTNIYGCDSVNLTINLNILNSTSSFNATFCEGGTYSWNGQQYSQPGQYTQTLTNQCGCDSVVILYLNTFYVDPPQICIVGMDSLTYKNRIVWEKPITLGIDSFYVYKENTISNVYNKIGATDYNDLAVFLDLNSNPTIQAYRYKISLLDTCGNESSLSYEHKTIHLTINQGIGGAWNLIWSHYEGLNFGSYNIYRGTDPLNISLLTTIQSNLNSYSDLTPPTGSVYYQIEVVNPVNCDPTKSINYGVSRSNIVNNGISGMIEIVNTNILIYPNPTSNTITLEVASEMVGKSFSIMDFSGRIIRGGKISSTQELIDLQDIARGAYYLSIENGSSVTKLIKQ